MEESASVLFRAVVVAAGVTGVGAGEVSWGSSDAGGGVLAPVGGRSFDKRASGIFFFLCVVAASFSGIEAGEVSWGSTEAEPSIIGLTPVALLIDWAAIGGRKGYSGSGDECIFHI